MTSYENLQKKGFMIDIIRIVDAPRKLYEVRIFKDNKSVSSKVNYDGVSKNLDNILDELYDEYIMMMRAAKNKKRTNKKRTPCSHCGATDHVKKYDEEWVCEKCAIFVDYE